MDDYCKREKVNYDCKTDEYYLFTWFIPKFSSNDNLNVNSQAFEMQNGYTYHANINASKDKITFSIVSALENLKCFVSMFIRPETLLFSNSLNSPIRSTSRNSSVSYYYSVSLTSENECFQKLKDYPNDTLVLICRIKYLTKAYLPNSVKTSDTSMDTLCNLKALASALKDSPESLLNEKVTFQVGDETETVSKAVLCARSPVFAKMFQNDMKELKENLVSVTDIKMPVLKDLVTFLYTGKLLNRNFDFLWELYYASDKYDIADLRQACIDLLVPQISMENVIQVLKFAFSYNDIQLKSTAMVMIAANIETWILTNDWRNFINDEPKIALEVLNFFDF